MTIGHSVIYRVDKEVVCKVILVESNLYLNNLSKRSFYVVNYVVIVLPLLGEVLEINLDKKKIFMNNGQENIIHENINKVIEILSRDFISNDKMYVSIIDDLMLNILKLDEV